MSLSIALVISDSDLAALREHFASGRTPASWRTPNRRHGPEVSVTLHVVALAAEPVDADEPWIATDGSICFGRGAGACAAVTSAGDVLAGWYDGRLPIADGSPYWELQGIRLGMRLADALPKGEIIPVVCDSLSVVYQVRNAVGGGSFNPATFECRDPALFSEVARLGREKPVNVVHRPHSGTGGANRAAAGQLEGVAHRVAWSLARLLRDGLDPAAQLDLLSRQASLATLNRNRLRKRYLARTNATGQ